MLKTVGTYILLVFGILANAASIAGLWLSYASAPPDAQARFGRLLLIIGSIGAASAYLLIAGLLFLRLRQPAQEKAAAVPPPPIPLLPDATVKDLDPKLEIAFVDDRHVTMSKDDYAYFEFINRGQLEAKFACMEHFQIGGLGYRVKPLKIGYEVPPGHSSKTIYIEIENVDTQPRLDIFDAFYAEWDALHRPQLHELKIPIMVTYQDAMRNLFETRCDLVFSPGAHLRQGDKVLETKNHKFRRVAVATPRINWEN